MMLIETTKETLQSFKGKSLNASEVNVFIKLVNTIVDTYATTLKTLHSYKKLNAGLQAEIEFLKKQQNDIRRSAN